MFVYLSWVFAAPCLNESCPNYIRIRRPCFANFISKKSKWSFLLNLIQVSKASTDWSGERQRWINISKDGIEAWKTQKNCPAFNVCVMCNPPMHQVARLQKHVSRPILGPQCPRLRSQDYQHIWGLLLTFTYFLLALMHCTYESDMGGHKQALTNLQFIFSTLFTFCVIFQYNSFR